MSFTYSGFADEIDKSIDIQMNVFDEMGIKYIETRGVNGTNVSSLTLEDAKEVKKEFDRRGFRVSALGSPIGKIQITDAFDEEIQRFKHTLEIARIFETKYIRMFSFFLSPEECPKYRDQVLKRLSTYLDLSRDSGIVLLHENEKDIYGDTADRCLDIFNSLGSDRIRATFDPANFVCCDEDVIEAYDKLADFVEYIHIKDSTPEKTMVPAGYGAGKIPELLSKVYARGGDYFLSLEPHLTSFEGFASLELGDGGLPQGDNRENFILAYKTLKKIVDEITA